MLTRAGSTPVIRTTRGVAQLVARMVRDHEVVGSNPVTPTIFSKAFCYLAKGFVFALAGKSHTPFPFATAFSLLREAGITEIT